MVLYTCVYVRTYLLSYIRTYIHTYVCTYMRTGVRTEVGECIYVHIFLAPTYVCTCVCDAIVWTITHSGSVCMPSIMCTYVQDMRMCVPKVSLLYSALCRT